MRQMFTSQRMETVEGVAAMLRDAGIEVHISNGRSYHSKRRGQFSYLDKPSDKPMPAVWVVRAQDQPRARDLLRKAGLLDSTRQHDELQHTSVAEFRPRLQQDAPRSRWTWRIRIGLLLLVAAISVFTTLRHRGNQAAAPATPTATAPETSQPAAPQEAEEVRIRIEPAAPPKK